MNNLKKLSELTHTLQRVESNLHEEKTVLEFILEQTTDGYFDWNIVTGYEYLSPKFKFQLGYLPEEMDNTPEAWQAICNKEDLDKAFITITSHLQGETESFTETLRFTHKQGHEITILCKGKVVSRDENGTPLRMIGTHTIIS